MIVVLNKMLDRGEPENVVKKSSSTMQLSNDFPHSKGYSALDFFGSTCIKTDHSSLGEKWKHCLLALCVLVSNCRDTSTIWCEMWSCVVLWQWWSQLIFVFCDLVSRRSVVRWIYSTKVRYFCAVAKQIRATHRAPNSGTGTPNLGVILRKKVEYCSPTTRDIARKVPPRWNIWNNVIVSPEYSTLHAPVQNFM